MTKVPDPKPRGFPHSMKTMNNDTTINIQMQQYLYHQQTLVLIYLKLHCTKFRAIGELNVKRQTRTNFIRDN